MARRYQRKDFSQPAIVAWTGGNTPRDFRDVVLSDTQFGYWFRAIRSRLFREQLTVWREYWGDLPDKHTRRTFWGRANYDAWSTLRAKAPGLFRWATHRHTTIRPVGYEE